MTDFSKIHSFKKGQADTFEELVCQLARKEKVPNNSVYKRVEGAGGDGGVEAYWTYPNGEKIGYQAKFFLTSGGIDWSQVEKSVVQAIKTHPELSKFVVAFPCDLTAKTGVKRKGKSGWEHWDEHVKKWKDLGKAEGIEELDFEAWPKSELISRLAKPENKGFLEYFFGAIELNGSWFEAHIGQTIVALDERFHPEDHVNVQIEQLFSALSRDSTFKTEIEDLFAALRKCIIPNKTLSSLVKQPNENLLECLEKSFNGVLNLEELIDLDLQHHWDQKDWSDRLDELLKTIRELDKWLWDYKQNADQKNKHEVEGDIQDNRKLQSTTYAIKRFVESRYLAAEQSRVAFITGKAGSGKSHLLAKVAQNALKQDQASILILGQQLNDSEIWQQVSNHLGLPNRSVEEILGALDAAGKASGARTIFLVDAINEGVGSRFWRNVLPSFIQKIQSYSHVCCAISCRSEYFELAAPKSIIDKFATFEIRGFETPEEQLEAARVYLDRRGIARPSTPWLAPEFVNPLLLRSVCVALELDGKSEIPVGMTGTSKILSFYLESVGRNIAQKEGTTSAIDRRLLRSVREIAREMLRLKQDFLTIDDGLDVISKQFKNITPNTEADWLSVLLNNGVLRKDPNPVVEDLYSDDEVVRFSFQRFQDFLFAELALDKVEQAELLFEGNGPLKFCIKDSRLEWDWRGVVDALAVLLPEKYSIELVDALPGGQEAWWSDWDIQKIFAESVRWRSSQSFTDRTLELLNDLDPYNQDTFETLLQVAVSAEHPWNAEMLHKNLIGKRLAKRDAFWTTWLNGQDDKSSVVQILIEWCKIGQAPQTNAKNQFLAGLTLCWMFTSSNRTIRDNATKALAALLLANQSIFAELLSRFAKLDDNYVPERLLAAAFAACCHDPDHDRIDSYASSVFQHIFSTGSPPRNLLLRDYAFGIIEMAKTLGCLPRSVNFNLCRPPFKSPRFRFSATEVKLEALAQKAGDNEILQSSTSMMGDFCSYEIKPRLGHFLNVPLNKKVKLTPEQLNRKFVDEVVGSDRKKNEAYDRLETAANPYSSGLIKLHLGARKTPSKQDLEIWQKARDHAEYRFLALLSENEKIRYSAEATPYLNQERSGPEDRKFDLQKASLWIAKKAYELGWNQKLFANDSSRGGSHSRERPIIERIGKKYQWIALDDLQCRMADNYWLEGEYGELPSQYQRPIDVGYERDIDPTILSDFSDFYEVSKAINSWAFSPLIDLPKVKESELSAWPFLHSPGEKLRELPSRTDDFGVEWLVLYEHQSKTEKYPKSTSSLHSFRMQEFRFVSTVILAKSDIPKAVSELENGRSIDFMNWPMVGQTDAAFLGEAPWRSTWETKKWHNNSDVFSHSIPYAPLRDTYTWESHLDASLVDGYSTGLPPIWLAQELGLQMDRTKSGVWLNSNNEVVYQEFKGEEGGTVALLRKDSADSILEPDQTFVSVLIAERTTWPGGGNDHAAWRRVEGLCWKSGRGMESKFWNSDNGNGDSKSYVPKELEVADPID